jgi:hypothetical protein
VDAPPQVVIVHAREVVVHEGVGVDDLDRGGQLGRIAPPTGFAVDRQREGRPEALAGAFERVDDGLAHRPGMRAPDLGTARGQHAVDAVARLREAGGIRRRRL